MDPIDRNILNVLRSDGRIANVELAARVGLAPSATLERVRKLEKSGVITGYEARLAPRKLGLGLQVIIALTTSEKIGEVGVGAELAKIPSICQVYEVAGKYSYLLKVMVRDTDDLGCLMRRIGQIPGVASSETILILSTLKDCASVAVAPSEGHEVDSPWISE